MGLSRNKVAVPEGAAGTPPFWSVYPRRKPRLTLRLTTERKRGSRDYILVYSVSEDYDMMIKEKSWGGYLARA